LGVFSEILVETLYKLWMRISYITEIFHKIELNALFRVRVEAFRTMVYKYRSKRQDDRSKMREEIVSHLRRIFLPSPS
jgi:hypothetical protein